MTDEDITKLANQLTQSLATKEDIKGLRFALDELNAKSDTILEFAEGIDETVADHEKRLKAIELIPAIAQSITK